MIHHMKIFQNWQQKYMEVIFYQEYVQIKNVRRDVSIPSDDPEAEVRLDSI